MESFSDNQSSVETIVFDEKDFIRNFVTNSDSDFDRLLVQKWTEALNKNVFKYEVTQNSLPSKVLNGKYRMIAQLNEGRATLRRKPDDMSSIRMPFNDQKFNYTRIKSEEVLFRLKSSDGQMEGTVVINNSPIEFCNSLLVPKLEDCRPQVLTGDALRLAICMVALSARPNLRVGFNSLGAMASVNHQHFHLYYYDYEMLIERLDIENNLLKGWPIDTLVFEIKKICFEEINECVESVLKLVDYCLKEDKNIAHNIFITRSERSGIRVFVWPRDPVFGAKDDSVINPAFCEFTGFFMCKTKDMFHTIDEEFCVQLLSKVNSRVNDLKHLLSS